MAKKLELAVGGGGVGTEYVGTAEPGAGTVGGGVAEAKAMTGGRDGWTRAQGVTTGSTFSVELLTACAVLRTR